VYQIQQPSYPRQQPAYAPAGTPAAGAQAYQPPRQTALQQPAYAQQQRSGNPNSVASDRLPPMPEMMRRPVAQTPPRNPVIRGGAPETTVAQPPRRVETVAQADWKSIAIPTPSQLGITPADAAPSAPPLMAVSTLTAPGRFDLATVTAWLDELGARSCQRERLAEGVKFVCTFGPEQTVTARGASDEEALKALVQEVLRTRQASTLSAR
jgi:hypothetical protein